MTALVAGALLITGSQQSSPSLSVSAGAERGLVSLELTVEPRVDSEFFVEGRPVPKPAVLLPRSEKPVRIRVTASGFQDAEIRAVPDRSRRIPVILKPAEATRSLSTADTRSKP